MSEFTNSSAVIDSRDVIARIEELTEEQQDLIDAVELADEEVNDAREALDDALDDAKEIEGLPDSSELESLRRWALDTWMSMDASDPGLRTVSRVWAAVDSLLQAQETLAEANEARQDFLESDEAEELKILQALAEEASDYASDWEYGETLIRYSYFTEYVQELVEECGYISPDLPWWIQIDWETTARNVSSDYASVDFDGVEYHIRSY